MDQAGRCLSRWENQHFADVDVLRPGGCIQGSVGNILGSNIFNLFLVIGGSSMILPLPIDPATLNIQIPIMIAFTLALLPSLLISQKISRLSGIALFAGYAGFIIYSFTGF